MRVFITQDDIDKGLPGMCGQCPTSRALMRQIPGRSIRVHLDCIMIDHEKVFLPASVSEWMRNFDCGLPVSPGQFVIPWGDRPWIDFEEQNRIIENMQRDPAVVEVFTLDYETVVAELLAKKELACLK